MIQRLGRQASKLNAAQTLLFPRSPLRMALSALLPRGDAHIATYVLHQQRHRLARAGFIQVQKRLARPEADILLLAPALDTPYGHPVVWEKLLSYAVQEAAHEGIDHIYADVADQPLLVNTLAHVGFNVYTRQTIWRLSGPLAYGLPSSAAGIRPQAPADSWALGALYHRITPAPVRQAEGMQPGQTEGSPIERDGAQANVRSAVLAEGGEVTACVQIVRGRRGTWIKLWAGLPDASGEPTVRLLRYALDVVRTESLPTPVYTAVCDYEGGLSALLDEAGFAPFTDRAKMAKHVLAWAREAASAPAAVLERVGEIVPTRFVRQGAESVDAGGHPPPVGDPACAPLGCEGPAALVGPLQQ